jgi:citronellol/citronellal dehydrogenase
VPLQRLAEEAEISAPIVFLLTPAAGFVTGICIAIDGGASRNTKLFPLQGGQNSKAYDGFHRAVRPKVLEKF